MSNVLFFLCVIPACIEGEKYAHTDIDASRNHTGIITSPGYPGNYPHNVHYTWTLKTENPKATIALNITDFNVVKYKFQSKCEDFLQIKMKEPCCQTILNRCGDFEPFNLEYKGNILQVTFVSDSEHNARGFNFSWTVYIPNTTTRTTTKPTTTTTINTTTKTTTTKLTSTSTTKTKTTTEPNSVAMKRTTSTATTTRPILVTKTSTTRTYTTTKNQKPMHTTNSTRKIQTLLSTQPNTNMNNITEKPTSPLDRDEILYLVFGIGVIEFTLVALGVYIVKQRRKNARHLNTEIPDKEKNRPVSRKSVASVGNIYESIPMDHFSIKDAISEEDECVYTEVPEHMYDKTFEHRPRVNVNPNLYQLISELKTKNR